MRELNFVCVCVCMCVCVCLKDTKFQLWTLNKFWECTVKQGPMINTVLCKSGGERQIPYDLTFRWNLINKTNKQAKYNQRH